MCCSLSFSSENKPETIHSFKLVGIYIHSEYIDSVNNAIGDSLCSSPGLQACLLSNIFCM